MAEPNQLNNRLDHLKATPLHENTERIDLPEQLFEKNQFIVKLSNETNDFKKVIIDKKHKTDAFPEQIQTLKSNLFALQRKTYLSQHKKRIKYIHGISIVKMPNLFNPKTDTIIKEKDLAQKKIKIKSTC